MQKSGREQLRILIVEDHDLLRKSFYKAFHDVHIVDTASSAEEGLELYHDKSPNIVFLDIGLPDASGHDLARRIKEESPATYVVMATVSDYPEDAEEAKRNNTDGFIVKPFDKKKISDTIDRYVAAHPSVS